MERIGLDTIYFIKECVYTIEMTKNYIMGFVSCYALSKTPRGKLSLRVLISTLPDLLPDVFCLMVRTFRLMLFLLHIQGVPRV